MSAQRSIMRAAARHPGLWVEALRAAAAMTARRWWARVPFLPVPHPPYLEWRLATAHGAVPEIVDGGEVRDYLRWRRRQRRA